MAGDVASRRGNRTSGRDSKGVFQPHYDWDDLRPKILRSIAEGATVQAACDPHGVGRAAFLLHVLDRGPREREYREAQKIALELEGDRLRELDREALEYVDLADAKGGTKRVPKIDPKAHGTVTRNIQWRMERLNSGVYGKETKHTHDVSDSLKERLDRLYEKQDQAQLEDGSGEGVIDAEFSVSEQDPA